MTVGPPPPLTDIQQRLNPHTTPFPPTSIYLQRAEAVVGRTNSVTGVPYADDPTIFAWDLINEPRCFQCGTTIGALGVVGGN